MNRLQNIKTGFKNSHRWVRRGVVLAVFGLPLGLTAVGFGLMNEQTPPPNGGQPAEPAVLAAEKSASRQTKTIKPTPSSTDVGNVTAAPKAPAVAPPAGPVAPSGSIGLPLYVDPTNSAAAYAASTSALEAHTASLIARMSQQPVAAWFGGWSSPTDVSNYVSKAATSGALPVLVAYNIPNRDCGGYSAGGAQTEAAYADWIQQFANAIAKRPALVILEPDAITLQDCLNGEQLAARNRELSSAIKALAAVGARVYLDAGHSGWLSAEDTAKRLTAAGLAQASGFALNVSNFGTTSSNVAFGSQVAASTAGKHFVVDTSRNGNGPTADGQWCNPMGRALGVLPTTNTGNNLVDAYLWIKTPWQSDGSCGGHPIAGQDDWAYAISLAQTAGW